MYFLEKGYLQWKHGRPKINGGGLAKFCELHHLEVTRDQL